MSFLNKYLSRKKDQQRFGSCTFIACVAAVEMLYRMSNKKIDDTFYFDTRVV